MEGGGAGVMTNEVPDSFAPLVAPPYTWVEPPPANR